MCFGLFCLFVQFPEFGHYGNYRVGVQPLGTYQLADHGVIVFQHHVVSSRTTQRNQGTTTRQHPAHRGNMSIGKAQFAQIFDGFFGRFDKVAGLQLGLNARQVIGRAAWVKPLWALTLASTATTWSTASSGAYFRTGNTRVGEGIDESSVNEHGVRRNNFSVGRNAHILTRTDDQSIFNHNRAIADGLARFDYDGCIFECIGSGDRLEGLFAALS